MTIIPFENNIFSVITQHMNMISLKMLKMISLGTHTRTSIAKKHQNKDRNCKGKQGLKLNFFLKKHTNSVYTNSVIYTIKKKLLGLDQNCDGFHLPGP